MRLFTALIERGRAGLLGTLLALLSWGLTAQTSLAAANPQTPEQCVQQLVFDPNSGSFLTSDNPFLLSQKTINCYAWQMFIAMNWPVNPGWPTNPSLAGEPDLHSPASQFGVPTHTSQPMSIAPLWSSYKDANDIFLPGAVPPSAWGVQAPAPVGCQARASLGSVRSGARKFLTATSESAVSARHRFHISSSTPATTPDPTLEATGGWLTDQAGNLVYFERKVGKAEFDYIVANSLYDAADQLRVATNQDGKSPQGLSLPAGAHFRNPPAKPVAQEQLGAFEIKAAWRILTGKPQLYSRYLTSVTWLQRPDTGECAQEVVGLVGLHIIHKTESLPDFVWTTFEHVDNVPDGGPAPAAGYTFNNPNCTGSSCTPNQERITCNASGCTDNFPRSEPVQVSREYPLSSYMNALNSAVQQAIASKTNGQSVFQYYKLINVLWDGSPTAPSPEPGANAPAPLVYGTFNSDGNVPAANTVLETYIQNVSCDGCHKNAKIAGKSGLAADFSFLFENADSAKQPTLIRSLP
ncbi:hypothetical protein NJC40_27070 [Pseudomonas sp. 21LCFQ02]|uniref:hypothetical protein n=1 Tax=Pseudomonas sp. 21LCFQ02 TaxID=2957505 RepID=UPI00209B13F8|nr:hypothetical protein [Pseudomonas sp. 21LCFQ02]MCO8171433.1 hypothetical protein [Pseudomonas sp. 21LCFQ02]